MDKSLKILENFEKTVKMQNLTAKKYHKNYRNTYQKSEVFRFFY